MDRTEFKEMTEDGILLLDGATGSNLYASGLPRGVCAEEWIIEHPDVIINLQKSYVEAGSLIIYAPTFCANRENLRRYHLESRLGELNNGLVALSRKASLGRAFVAGDMTTTGLILESIGGEATVEEVSSIYAEQAEALLEAGVDLIVIETMISEEETEIAAAAVRALSEDIPLLCTMSVQADGRGMFGGTIFEASESLPQIGVDSVGCNCSMGPDQMIDIIRHVAGICPVPVIAKPNAGLPEIDKDGNAIYPMRAEDFVFSMINLIDAGAAIVGGCCGTTPDFIQKLSVQLDGRLVRRNNFG